MSEPDERKIFVGGLGSQTTTESLRSFFVSNYGAVIDCRVMEFTDKNGMKRSRGFGFVTFETMDALEASVREHNVDIDGKIAEIKKIDQGKSTNEGKNEIESRKIFCGGLADTVDSDKLREFFAVIDPNLVEARVVFDFHTQRSRCFGYVTFSDKPFVDKAVANRESNYIDGKWIDVKPCTIQKGAKGKGKGELKGASAFGKGQYAGAYGVAPYGFQPIYGAPPYGMQAVYDPSQLVYAAAPATAYGAAQAVPGQAMAAGQYAATHAYATAVPQYAAVPGQAVPQYVTPEQYAIATGGYAPVVGAEGYAVIGAEQYARSAPY